uniref:Uncharacterized protein n=1 Tax=Arundo donax TaxID=35708 RepID=A0A0A8YEV3_ARUDO
MEVVHLMLKLVNQFFNILVALNQRCE